MQLRRHIVIQTHTICAGVRYLLAHTHTHIDPLTASTALSAILYAWAQYLQTKPITIYRVRNPFLFCFVKMFQTKGFVRVETALDDLGVESR
jgi:hypothetical protein